MPFYFRKSIKLGLFRVNLSGAGVGVSAGVRGFRVGTGPRGHYVHAGMGGIYYRQNLGGRASRRGGGGQGRRGAGAAAPLLEPEFGEDAVVYAEPAVRMVEIESGDVAGMRSEAFDGMIGDIERRRRRLRLAVVLPLLGFVVAMLLAWRGQPDAQLWTVQGFAAGLVLAVPLLLVGMWVDAVRRRAIVAYDLDEGLADRYADMCEAFDSLMGCAGAWHVAAAGRVENIHASKRNAGAGTIVARGPSQLSYRLPQGWRSNLTPPAVSVGRQVLYFLPDHVLVEDRGRYGGTAYASLVARAERSQFVEDGPVPRDAEILGSTWLYVNKSGGPDKRFRNNRQLPICAYESLALRSGNGLAEMLEFSRVGPAAEFATTLAALAVPSVR